VQSNLNAAIQGDAAAADFTMTLIEQAGGLVPVEMEQQGGVLVVPGMSKNREEWNGCTARMRAACNSTTATERRSAPQSLFR